MVRKIDALTALIVSNRMSMSGPILTHESPIKEIPIKKKKEYSLANEINALDRQEKRNAKRLKNIKGFHNK